ncbi:hypothetical protein [Methylobacterium nodulans]|uniref:ASCH domain-containing protein n=1 Tax=Methylobacterium nodulans (strain LMG 21967 / CNCM I-2342 / ORS 2060) TaxID=460265 RepID=B8INY4_METNO|nr:hypothetical protein [Methylobacterium nodulans]ACL58500.1 conserved hypothetical protein [Methylobacterium nodulans ORS 2060]
MVDRPIIFSAPMIRALLAGRKTQTRRLCKPMNKWVHQEGREVRLHQGQWCHFLQDAELPIERLRLPWQVGDRLWVRETWAVGNIYDGIPPRNINPGGKPNWCGIRYAATDERLGIKDRSPIHMPRWASRLTLIVTDVRVERLQDISEEDARAEGCEHDLWDHALAVRDYSAPDKWLCGWGTLEGRPGYVPEERIFRESFRSLWESINGAKSWADNPWICASSFRVIQQNIDAIDIGRAA